MPEVLRIAKWKGTFEKSDAQRMKSLPWISVPTSMDSNGFVLMAEDFGDDAPAIYGAWIALCQYAAGCAERGTLATSRGEPIPLSRVARKAGWTVAIFERLVEWATSERIGWIEVLGENGSPRTPSGCHPYYGHNGHNGHNDTDGRTKPPDESPPVRPVLISKRWEEIQPNAIALHRAIDPGEHKLKKIDRELTLRFAAMRVVYPELEEDWARMLESVATRTHNKKPLGNPWAWLKSEMIRVCNDQWAGYDAMIKAIDMRERQPA